MNDPVAVVARAAAQRLEAEDRPGLGTEVEAALAARESGSTPSRYADPLGLASLIVGIASLAWSVYTELRKRTAKPPAEVVARTVRVRLQGEGQIAAPPDHIVDVVVTEAIRAAGNQ
jgi:hypothetical protein